MFGKFGSNKALTLKELKTEGCMTKYDSLKRKLCKWNPFIELAIKNIKQILEQGLDEF